MTYNIKEPPENLVIYEVRGQWDPDENAGLKSELGQDFLGFWIESDYTFFFFSSDNDLFEQLFLNERPDLSLRYVHHMKYSQWQDGAGFNPFSAGPLKIMPAWNMDEDDLRRSWTDASKVFIDPGLAFGFGGHPTTMACLRALSRVYKEDAPRSVLDLGTGTGVLAVAAAKLGAENVQAVEYSHLAAETAQRNTRINGLESRIKVIRGMAESHIDFPADLVCSNLHLAVQESLLKAGGFNNRKWLILSGLFHDESEKIEPDLQALGYKIIDKVRDDRWTTLLLAANRPV